jgi:predicted metal-dependent hydrolase
MSLRLISSGLEVVLPAGADPALASVFVREHHDWIAEAVKRNRARLEPVLCRPLFPEELQLRATGETFRLRVTAATGKSSLSVNRSELCVAVAGTGSDAAVTMLLGWLKRKGHAFLVPRCRELAERHGLEPAAVRIAVPGRRWGSCSARGTVMLNARLLFLPPALCDAVIYHELAHLAFLDHSQKFWRYLVQLQPDAVTHDTALKEAGRYLPGWAAMR